MVDPLDHDALDADIELYDNFFSGSDGELYFEEVELEDEDTMCGNNDTTLILVTTKL